MRRVDGEVCILGTARGAKIGPSEERGEVGRVSESGCRKREQRFCGRGSLGQSLKKG
jgi:hypothetical protein